MTRPRPIHPWRLLLVVSLWPLLILGPLLLVAPRLHPFLAIDQPVGTGLLIVEGWLPDYAVMEGRHRFEQGGYRLLVTTGGPLDVGSHLSEHRTYAELATATLRATGMDPDRLLAVPAPYTPRERTYRSALALRDYCHQHQIPLDAVDVLSLGPHARRSQLAFRAALGPDVPVGIIPIADRSYDPHRWWAYSQGVKSVLGETLAWLYARLHLDLGY